MTARPRALSPTAKHSNRCVLWPATDTVVVIVAQVFVCVVLSPLLESADFGAAAIAEVTVAFCSILLPFGFGDAIIQRASLHAGHCDSAPWLRIVGAIRYFLVTIWSNFSASIVYLSLRLISQYIMASVAYSVYRIALARELPRVLANRIVKLLPVQRLSLPWAKAQAVP